MVRTLSLVAVAAIVLIPSLSLAGDGRFGTGDSIGLGQALSNWINDMFDPNPAKAVRAEMNERVQSQALYEEGMFIEAKFSFGRPDRRGLCRRGNAVMLSDEIREEALKKLATRASQVEQELAPGQRFSRSSSLQCARDLGPDSGSGSIMRVDHGCGYRIQTQCRGWRKATQAEVKNERCWWWRNSLEEYFHRTPKQREKLIAAMKTEGCPFPGSNAADRSVTRESIKTQSGEQAVVADESDYPSVMAR